MDCYYTGTQSFKTMLSLSMTQFFGFLILIGYFTINSVQTFQPINLICTIGNLVYSHLGIYINLSSIDLSLNISVS